MLQWKESTLSQTAILLTCIILTTYVLSTDYVFKKKKKYCIYITSGLQSSTEKAEVS